MLTDYLPVGILILLATGLALLIVAISIFFGPKRHQSQTAKVQPYESGMKAIGPGQRRLPVRFYLTAVLFIVFDIEIIFFYPFTQVYGALGWFGLVAIGIFTVAVFESFLYLISNGALDWGPPQHLRRSRLHRSPERTTASTVRRVGLDGRAAELIAAVADDSNDAAQAEPDKIGAH